MDPINLLQKAIEQTGGIVSGVKPDQLGDSTPCTDWDVRALLSHTIAAVQLFDDAARAVPFNPARFGADNVGSDPADSYASAAAALNATLGTPGVLDGKWTMPFGEVPGTMGAAFATLELTMHGWDVARATGQQPEWDPAITEVAFTAARMAPAELIRTPGVYGPELTAPEGAPTPDQLAAFLGRAV
jgi:uncharacterized protein (TIGR03086 family)